MPTPTQTHIHTMLWFGLEAYQPNTSGRDPDPVLVMDGTYHEQDRAHMEEKIIVIFR